MKKYALALVMVVLLAGVGYSPAGQAQAQFAPCSDAANFAQLETLTGGICTIDDKLFGAFDLTGSFPDPTLITVTVVDSGGVEGFIFQFPFTAVNQSLDFGLFYSVLCAGAVINCIVSAELAFIGGADLGGAARVDELVCLGTTVFSAACSPNVDLHVSTGGSNSAEKKFDGTFAVAIGKDIAATCLVSNGCTGSASISVLTNTVDQTTPEPATLLLFGAGLAGLGLFRRRKA